MTNIIFYHNDMDGRYAASIVDFWMNEIKEYSREINKYPEFKHRMTNIFVKCDYNEKCIAKIASSILKNYDKNDINVFIVDLSFTKKDVNTLISICKQARNIFWIDHHLSSYNLIQDMIELNNIANLFIKINMNSCGALLCHRYIHEVFERLHKDNQISNPSSIEYVKLIARSKTPYSLLYVDDWDRHMMMYEETLSFKLGVDIENIYPSDGMYQKIYTEEIEKHEYVNIIPDEAIIRLISKGSILNTYLRNKYSSTRSYNAYEVLFEGYKAVVINEFGPSDILFGRLIKKYDICISYVETATGFSYTIYSESEKTDCSKIAEKYGGGGHRGAAGFTTTNNVLIGLEKRKISR